MTTKTRTLWAFALSSIAIFMTALDNLVVTTALPVIKQQLGGEDRHARMDRQRLHADLRRPAADRRGARGPLRPPPHVRRRPRHLHPRVGRRRARPVDPAADRRPRLPGSRGAIITPLTLTILTGAVPAEKRGAAFGAWSGIQGLAVAIGPLVGGAVTEGISWQWIFWLNVPIGLIALPFARTKLSESYGPNKNIDLPGIGLASAGLLGHRLGARARQQRRVAEPRDHRRSRRGIAALIGFVAWELRTADADAADALLPQSRLRRRERRLAGDVLRDVRIGVPAHPVPAAGHGLQPPAGRHPHPRLDRDAAVHRPAAGALSDRIGGRPIMAFGLALDAIAFGWIAYNAKVGMSYGQLLPALVMAGIGTASFLAPVANVVMSAVRPEEAGQASGATNAIREIGGVLGIAVLAAVFSGTRRLRDAERVRRRVRPGADDRRDHGRHRRCRGAADPAAAARHRRDAEAGSGGRLHDRRAESSTRRSSVR